MWRLWAACGYIVWLMTIVASATINYIAGTQYGRSFSETQVFAMLGVSADAWKAIGPLFVIALWRSDRRATSGVAFAVWLACAMFAITAALGVATQVRTAVIGKREGSVASYQALERDLLEAERQRANRTVARATSEIETNIAEVLARAVGQRGTVASLSDSCLRNNGRTREACAQVAALRMELATAVERDRLAARIEMLRGEVGRLRGFGGAANADPQSQLLARLSNGLVSAGDVALLLVLLLVVMVELISAFAPLVIQEYVGVHARRVAIGRAAPRTVAARRGRSNEVSKRRQRGHQRRQLLSYLAQRICPDDHGRVAVDRVFSDFVMWCVDGGRKPMKRDVFLAILDTIAKSELDGKVLRRGDVYQGFTLNALTV